MNNVKSTFTGVQLIIQFFIELIISMFLGYLIGQAIDSYLWEEKHLFLFIFIFLGLFSSVINLVKRTFKMMGESKNADKKPKSD
ncbi:MAG: AtpZ/AtpI family protein [Firmicutes bacterium]|nr:AtpZ/AtpI family protein [Bacillota bacterium]